jgi:hypothetical protein
VFALVSSGEPAYAAAAPSADESQQRDPRERELVVLTGAMHVDKIYKSMTGPIDTRAVKLLGSRPPELLWLTGYSMDVVGEDGETPDSMEFECHSSLSWPRKPQSGLHRPVGRAFTLSGGQTDLRFPPGFGLPVWSDEVLTIASQVLNLNRPDIDQMVRHRTRVRYVRDGDLTKPMKPLVQRGTFVMVSLKDGAVYSVEDPNETIAEASCQEGAVPPNVEGHVYKDDLNRPFAGHWVVPPGRHEYHMLVTEQMQLPYDTTLHFIGVHVHPYSESLELRDLNTGETVWKSEQRNLTGRVGLEWIDYFSQEKGLPIYKDHDYELISVYDNTSGKDSDGMASMFLYYLDKEFSRSALDRPTSFVGK